MLVAAVVTLGGWAVRRAQSRNTESTLKIVQDALDQFAGEAPLQSVQQKQRHPPREEFVKYKDRYGQYPPDELEMFTKAGLPRSIAAEGTLAPGGAVVKPGLEPSDKYPFMKFYTKGLPDEEVALEHRDLAAMVLAIDLFSDSASSILGQIPSRFRSEGATSQDGTPLQFLDRKDNGWTLTDDEQIRYIVDAWGVPLGYFAERNAPQTVDIRLLHPSRNAKGWNRTSTELIHLNRGKPVIFSYGPNGKDQLTESNADSVLAVDWKDNKRIDNPLNDDNVYVDPSLAERLARGK